MSRPSTHEADRIGDILRRVREHRKEDLETISDYLRIRLNYLVALENNRYEDLPADAYVIGFLRTYALYLGLDGKGAIDHYRREMAGRRRKPSLTMPKPMPEGRAPTATVLTGAATAVVIIFLAWYGLSSPDTTTPTVAVASSRLDPSGNNETLATQTATSDGIALNVPVTAITTNQVDIDLKGPERSPDSISTSTEAKPSLIDNLGAEVSKDPVKEVKNLSPKSDVVLKDKIDVEPIPPLPLAPQEPMKSETPTVYGEKTKSRVTIKSDKESWIMITDSKGITVFEKTLKPGEAYNVPSTKGLKLTTSNPSGIVFQLDGATLPKINSSDEIARAIPLEPDKLKNRTTEAEQTPTE